MSVRHRRINRKFSRTPLPDEGGADRIRADAPRTLRRTVIDFTSLGLPSAVSLALAEAFWSQVKARSDATVYTYWSHLKVFGKFVQQTRTVLSFSDIGRELLVRYIEWLNIQRSSTGEPWSKATRSAPYMTLCVHLRWLQRCRPGVLGEIDFPLSPFPWRNRDAQRIARISAEDLRAILKACERDITRLRALRADAQGQINAAQVTGNASIHTLGGFLDSVDQRYGGIIPQRKILQRPGHHRFRRALEKLGGSRRIAPCLYPLAESLLPYYLAIQIHTAGNPESITKLRCDCLQPIPLIEDRELLVWTKTRAGALQRRSFRSTDPFEPPALVREIIEWTRRLRPHSAPAHRERLLIYRGVHGARAFSMTRLKDLRASFAARHQLPDFTLAALRPSVLTAFYRASGDLRSVKTIANHAQLSTTVGYVQAPEVQTQNRRRVATLQSAFLGHLGMPLLGGTLPAAAKRSPVTITSKATIAPRAGVSIFGFDCKDPFAGLAPGTRRGELCTYFLGCFTCPNAIIAHDTATLARLLQARDHLREAAAHLHPARWEALYAPQLRILEEDILTRFGAGELAQAQRLRIQLPPLLPLR